MRSIRSQQHCATRLDDASRKDRNNCGSEPRREPGAALAADLGPDANRIARSRSIWRLPEIDRKCPRQVASFQICVSQNGALQAESQIGAKLPQLPLQDGCGWPAPGPL